MTTQDYIRDTILKAKNYIGCLAYHIIEREQYGDNIECAEKKMALLANLIETAEFHYCFNYGDNGAVTPDYDCLTYEQAQNLIATINGMMK